MKSIKVIYFLILFKIISSLLLKSDFSSLNDDYHKCYGERNITKCNSVEFSTPSFQCCRKQALYTYEEINPTKSENCAFIISHINEGSDEIQTEKGKSMIKEYDGFSFFGTGYEPKCITQELNFTCSDGSFDYTAKKSDYTEEEKKIFRTSENLCLRFMLVATKENATKNACYNSILATAGNDTGVSCGFYEITLNFNDSTSYKYNTCFLFNDDILQNKKIGYLIKFYFGYWTVSKSSVLEKELSYFKLKFSNSKSKDVIYDSLTDEVIIDNTDNNSQYYLNFIYYIYLLLLIIILW